MNPFKGFENKFNEVIMTLFEMSGDICVIVGLIGAILFIFGYKKGKDIPFITWGIYLIIRIIGGVILGV